MRDTGPSVSQAFIGNCIQDAELRAKIMKQPIDTRNYHEQIVQGHLHDFVQSAEGASKCGKCQDLPVLNPELPPFVR